jgi:hypothetical protein
VHRHFVAVGPTPNEEQVRRPLRRVGFGGRKRARGCSAEHTWKACIILLSHVPTNQAGTRIRVPVILSPPPPVWNTRVQRAL